MASNRGPAAVAPPPNYNQDSAYYKSRDSGNAYAWAQKGAPGAGGVGGSWASASVASQAREPYHHQETPSITINQGITSGMPNIGGGGTAVADGSYEKQLILELCPPGGMKAEPPPDKLNQFARSVANLNPDLVCPVLLDCLEEGQPWIIRAKALCVIEACMKHGQKPGATSNAYTDFFHACSGEIAPLSNHSRVQIRDPAKRVLGLMGVATPVSGVAPPPTTAPPAPAPSAPVQNLLDFDDETPAPAPLTEETTGGPSLFGGLSVAGHNTAAAAPPAAAPSAPPPPPASGNLLGDWLSDPATEVSQPSAGSLFGDMMVKETPAPTTATAAAPQPTQVSSMFDSLSLKSEDTTTPVGQVASGSAFGFINESISIDSHSEKKIDAVPVPRDSFDPLKNMTPTTHQKMMQVSPEQMQAMLYQQMMMQQQMQMAQMMALQQQRGMFAQPKMQNGFAFVNNNIHNAKPVKTEDKKFDFVQDAMSMEKKK